MWCFCLCTCCGWEAERKLFKWMYIRNQWGCDETWTLKKKCVCVSACVHMPLCMHVCLAVCACMHECLVEVRWVRRFTGLRCCRFLATGPVAFWGLGTRKTPVGRQLLQKPDSREKPNKEAMGRENQANRKIKPKSCGLVKDVKVEGDEFVCQPKLLTTEST